MRILFFAGKGGVGKTSVAAATGMACARQGKRTIILSLDVAHSLSDVFDLEKGLLDFNRGEPVRVHDRLWIQELDIQREIEENWGDIHSYLSTLLRTSGLDEILAEELAVLPGMEEVNLLLYINRYVRKETYDVIILDCAPTGESLRFISIPTTLEWYIKKIFKVERTIARYMRPVARRVYDVPIPGEEYFDTIERLFERLRGVDRILTDPGITSVRLVTNPEKIVLKETQRAFMYFCLFGMHIDAVIMNRVLPEAVRDDYFRDWRKNQKRYMETAEAYFSPVPILTVNLFREEILGPEDLALLGEEIYAGREPLDHFQEGAPLELTKEAGGYRIRIRIPFAAKGDIRLNRISDELVIRLGGYKKHVMLPRSVAAARSARARFEEPYLVIDLGDAEDGKGKG